MLLEAFKKNPVMLYMHFRDEGSPIWGETKAIGHWEDIQLEGDVLSAIPVFDKVDQLSKDIAAKYEAGTYNAASVGIRIIATSANKDLPGTWSDSRNSYRVRADGSIHRGHTGKFQCRSPL